MKRPLVLTFLATQLAAELFSWIAPHVSGVGPWLWLASVILLLPGDLIATWMIEKFLWTSGLTPLQLQILKTVFEVALNVVVWVLVSKQWIRIRARLSGRSAESPGS